MRHAKTISAIAAASLLSACAAGPAPRNYTGASWAPGQEARGTSHPRGDWEEAPAELAATSTCMINTPAEIASLRRTSFEQISSVAAPLSTGDRLRIDILGDPDGLSGTYVVSSDGRVTVPGLLPLRASGLSERDFARDLRAALVSSEIVRPLRNAVSVSLIEAAGVPTAISGAVFRPGAVRAGERTPESRIGLKEGLVRGDDNTSRTVSGAIRAAGGVRPDASVARVFLIRGGSYLELDLSGLVHGYAAQDAQLAAGDRIIVPSQGCFDTALVRPGPLTAPGIRVYMSNLTRSANNNAGAAIGKDTTSLPYGTRLLQALVAMNCVGGSYMTSDRRAVLISRNPMTGQSIVIERDIEKLVRMADRDEANPYLMPDDAIACYDSRWSNLREALGMVSDAVSTATPALLLSKAID